MIDKTHLPVSGNKRPHVPVERLTIGEVFRMIESGEAVNKPDADYTSLQNNLKRRARNGDGPPVKP